MDDSSSSLQLSFLPRVISPCPGEVDGLQLALKTYSSSFQVCPKMQNGASWAWAVRYSLRENNQRPLEPELYSFDALSFGRYDLSMPEDPRSPSKLQKSAGKVPTLAMKVYLTPGLPVAHQMLGVSIH